MDNFILRWYNQNRRAIWTTIVGFIMIITVIQSLNNYYKKKEKEEGINTISNTNSVNIYDEKNDYSVTTKEKIEDDIATRSNFLIDDFLAYCNDNQIEKAYYLISNECKEELYPTMNDFKTKYYDRVFTGRRNYKSVLWIESSDRNTYRVEMFEDALASGKKDNMPIEEYYTIVKEDGNYKLNIHGYIGKEDVQISKNQIGISINVVCRKKYIDFEKYEITIKNNTGKNLVFNKKQNPDSIYIQDENELKYIAYINEITDSNFEILRGETKTLNIRFNRGYKPTIRIKSIVFGDINGEEEIKIDL